MDGWDRKSQKRSQYDFEYTSLEIFPTFLHCAIAQSLAYHLCPCPSHDAKVNVNKKESCLSANFLLRWIPVFVRQEKLQLQDYVRALKSASPELFRALNFTTLNFSSDAVLTCFDMEIASVPYQNIKLILWYDTKAISVSKQVKQHRKKNLGW